MHVFRWEFDRWARYAKRNITPRFYPFKAGCQHAENCCSLDRRLDRWGTGLACRDGESLLGEGRAELLAEIDRLHSITKAAKEVGMSYRRAWSLIKEANQAAGVPLVKAAVGGTTGGGAKLTAEGKLALEVFEQLRSAVHSTASGILQRIIHAGDSPTNCLHLAAAISLQEAVGQLLAAYSLAQACSPCAGDLRCVE